MKNINYIINGVLAVAVIVLFFLQCSGKKTGGSGSESVAGDSSLVNSPLLPIAYINTDTLLLNYNFAKDLNEGLLRKAESSQASLNQKKTQIQAEIMDYQNKVNNNAFLSPERRAQEEARLQKKSQDLQEQSMRLQDEFGQEQMKVNQQLSDTVISILHEYNKEKKYQVIFSNMGRDNILVAGEAYDITTEVLEFLNKRYTPIAK